MISFWDLAKAVDQTRWELSDLAGHINEIISCRMTEGGKRAREECIVKSVCQDAFGKFKVRSKSAWRLSPKVSSKFIHGRNTSGVTYNGVTCEAGDILFIVTVLENNTVLLQKMAFAQVKKAEPSRGKKGCYLPQWKINLTQLRFLTFWPPFEGKGVIWPRRRTNRYSFPGAISLGYYLLLHPTASPLVCAWKVFLRGNGKRGKRKKLTCTLRASDCLSNALWWPTVWCERRAVLWALSCLGEPTPPLPCSIFERIPIFENFTPLALLLEPIPHPGALFRRVWPLFSVCTMPDAYFWVPCLFLGLVGELVSFERVYRKDLVLLIRELARTAHGRDVGLCPDWRYPGAQDLDDEPPDSGRDLNRKKDEGEDKGFGIVHIYYEARR